jgi:acetyl/propionyl-CoA carboxylase alpha subunit
MRRSITKLLVASRGESARRVVRTAREMGIATVAVFTEGDRRAGFVGEADEAVALDRFSERHEGAYLDPAALVEAARRAGADAVHPGYGLVTGDAGLAWRCAEAGLVFVGPPPEAIAVLSSRLEAKAVAAAAGVPVLTDEEVDGYPPGKLEAAAEVLGWPVAVKAAAAGGRAGAAAGVLRVVRDGDDLVGAVEAVRREATAVFGDGTVFFEPWLEDARHVAVQIFADAAGRVVHLFERDCTVADQHRSVIVEAPAPKLPQPVREQLVAAAVTVAEAVGYAGAGTAEFLVAGEQIWFVELHSGLDANHAVTEAILGLDLVRMQLQVAEGRPLPVEARHCSPSGHAVAARLFRREPGAPARVRRFETGPGVPARVETDLVPGSVVDDGAATGLATVVAHAASRGEALRRLATALEHFRIQGLRTNRDRLIAALRHPDLRAGPVDGRFLDGLAGDAAGARGGDEAGRLHAAAAALSLLADAPAGSVTFTGPGGEPIEVAYRAGRGGAAASVEVDGVALPDVRVGAVTPDGVDLEVAGLRRRVAVTRSANVIDCDSSVGHTELVLLNVCSES